MIGRPAINAESRICEKYVARGCSFAIIAAGCDTHKYAMAMPPAIGGCSAAAGRTYFFDRKNDSKTPRTAPLRGSVPGTCAIVKHGNCRSGWLLL